MVVAPFVTTGEVAIEVSGSDVPLVGVGRVMGMPGISGILSFRNGPT